MQQVKQITKNNNLTYTQLCLVTLFNNVKNTNNEALLWHALNNTQTQFLLQYIQQN